IEIDVRQHAVSVVALGYVPELEKAVAQRITPCTSKIGMKTAKKRGRRDSTPAAVPALKLRAETPCFVEGSHRPRTPLVMQSLFQNFSGAASSEPAFPSR
ncbi:MAG: hypothetical protein AB7U27_13550, partial [Aminobacteriaceae bacterium]